MKQAIPVKVGQIIELSIERINDNADGVGRVEGFTVFVPETLPGETVRAKVELVKKNYARAIMQELVVAAGQRTVPRCPVYAKCGGCQLQHLSYHGQLLLKKQIVMDALHHIGGFNDIEVMDTIGADEPWHYRNKMQFPVGRQQGKPVIGCFAPGSHAIIDTPRCYIQHDTNNIIAAVMREAIARYQIPVYDEDSHRGVLRHVMGRVGKNGQCMVVLVTAGKNLPHSKEIVKMLRDKVPGLVGVLQNIQSFHNNVILGRETNLLWGKSAIDDAIGELTYHISPRSFFQVNTAQAKKLYDTVREYAGLTGNETVMDVYCGTGTIGLYLSPKAARVYGIEIVSPAINDAKKNARDNNRRNAEFMVGDATKVLPRLYREGLRADVIVIDPPRAGCTPQVIDTLAGIAPDKIVYVSCNPATLARDLSRLVPQGYKITKVRPVDMFPMTVHVETVVLITRNI